MGKPTICICENKVTAKLISAVVFATWIVHFLFFINPLLALFCACAGRFVSDLFGNHIVGFPTRRLTRKAVIRGTDQIQHKPACAVREEAQELEILELRSGTVVSGKQKTIAFICCAVTGQMICVFIFTYEKKNGLFVTGINVIHVHGTCIL